MFDIPEELKKLPDKPGVYLMHDKNDAIIYVGKAISLKNRVRQYFQSSRNKTAKIEKMVSLIDHFEYIITDSELEALVLECNLIKEHRPKYNTMLTDDKSYPYIKVTLGEQFPRVLFSRQMKKDKSKYFGPYTSSEAVRETIELLTKLYKIRSCSRVLPRDIGKGRPCLNYHIKRCLAPCQGNISEEEYKKNIDEVLRFLNGDYSKILKMLEDTMYEAAQELDFEKAAEYRELLKSVQQIAQKQKITHADGEDQDIIAMAKEREDAVIQVFFVRGGRMIGREHFYMKIPAEDDNGKILNSFVKQFYAGTPYIPKELMLQEEVEDAQLLETWLSDKKGRKVYVRVPQKGAKEKLVELAAKNAKMVLEQDAQRIKREEGRTIGAVKEIASWLGLEKIERMEAYDISNTSGYQSVGSMVVFEKGKPQRSDYRKFKLKTVIGPDDYASMREVLTRRFTHGQEEAKDLEERGLAKEMGSFTKFPDLIMMDGGKGQVNIALEVLEQLGLHIPVCGMVKDDHHRTRGLYFQNEEIPIDIHSEGFHLITRIQDEAHRFAIEFHRSLRGKNQVHSVLDDIEGIGPARRKALMKHYRGIEQIKNATEEELMQVPGMNRQAAGSVYRFFHS
ncbi:excinuclease ABC subunit UvrC [Eubacterium oxidoreducens]|uniref:UvrABC system protein C n=1 Tax=Eubacterium oxidoreducens TaxID=1732 RepID=A0A1G6CAD2_EUBOX|nr:excinuclease ABC subunit UvrC [Eubacterium oxidoreducens]SDB29867.1 Excinuclease ABC subunit C [Eubacterium oxidoreducens]